MLSAKPWKAEAVIRLLVSLLICQFLGSLAVAVVRFGQTRPPANPWLFGALAAVAALLLGFTLFSLRHPWSFDRFARRFLVILVCFYLGVALGALAHRLTGKADDISVFRTLAAALFFQGVTLALVWRFLREHGTAWREGFGLSVKWPQALIWGTMAAALFLPVAQFLQMAGAEWMSRLRLTPETQPAIQALHNTATVLDRVGIGIAAIALAPVAEEMLFRGILYPAIKGAGFPRLALWGTALLFALVHWNVATFVPLLLLALLLAALYEKTGNLLAPIAAHAVFNALNFVLFFLLQARSAGPV